MKRVTQIKIFRSKKLREEPSVMENEREK